MRVLLAVLIAAAAALPAQAQNAGPDTTLVEPVLIGGLGQLMARVVYPEQARREDIQGTVFVQFEVDEAGAAVNPTILRSPHDLLSEAAVRAVRQSQFAPGTRGGVPVRVRYVLPVRFELRDD
jgi:TonB family protein